MSALRDRLEAALASRRSREMLRSLDPLPSTSSGRPVADLVDFSSNDYLSLSRSPILRDKLVSALANPSSPSPFGPPSSRLLDGNSPAHLSLERTLSSFFSSPTGGALLFNSGFDANVGVWSCLPGPSDYILYDSLVHASIHDGMRSSRVARANRISVQHNSLADLEAHLARVVAADAGVKSGDKSVWIGVESLYSMDGDLCPLSDMVQLVERVLPNGNGHFVVDEAHSTGLYGSQGRGLVSALGLEDRITVRLHTFGKAMACSGAVVLVTPLIRQYLVNYARPLIYSTVTPHMNVQAMTCAIEMLQQGYGDGPRERVHELAALLIARLGEFLDPTSSCVSLPPHLLPPHYPPLPSPPPSAFPSSSSPPSPCPSSFSSSSSPHRRRLPSLPPPPPTSSIVPLLTTSPRPLSAFLRELGFLVRPITYPTVPRGMERVRVCLHAANTTQEILGLAEGVRKWVDKEMEEQRQQERNRTGRRSDEERILLRARL